jgi:outer membrane protein OmpA-like peptidoglycan-associated protein
MVKNYLTKIIFSAALFACLSGHAQVNEVLKASQFGGITNVSFNPAIADNPFLVDINLVSAGLGLENNYIGLNSKALTHPSLLTNSPDIQSDQLTERLNGNPKSVFLGMSVQGPLSFMVSFGKKRNNKNAIGFSYHTNAIFNIDGVSQQFARIAYYGLGSKADSIQPFNYQNLNNQNFGTKMLAWGDVGLTYSRVLYDQGAHLFKAGVTGKALVGLAGAYISSKNINYKFKNYDTLDIYNSDLSYGHSADVSNIENPSSFFSNILGSKSKTSFGADLGMVYEWRPNKEKFQYDYDCQKWYHNDVNKYKLAVGFSVIDIGRVVFSRPNDVSSYTANIQGWLPGKSGINSVATFDSVLAHTPGFTSTNKGSFQMWLPTRFNLYIDYEIYKGLGLNLNGVISPNLAKDANQVHYPTSIALTPRYDCKWFGAYIPLTYDQYGNFGAGFGLRAGPIFVTSSNIITALADKYTYALNLQVGVKITIPYLQQKVHKKNNNYLPKHVTDSICPSTTTDLYHYYHKDPNKLDFSTPTPKSVGAGSYIVTHPNPKGGCPDSSYVTILNRQGPKAGGNKTASVCAGSAFDLTTLYPNADYSGYEWNTTTPTAVSPGTYKLVVKNAGGCTDTAVATVTELARPGIGGGRTDSIFPGSTYDLTSMYPNSGYKTYNWTDLPKNAPVAAVPVGVYHLEVTGANGCTDIATATIVQKIPPVLTKKEVETIKYAFDNLEFETAKAIIKVKSHISLDQLAALLVDKGYGLRIDGHTDNVGTADYNMDLSLRRAEAVKAYLVDKGVVAARLETNGYGLTKPIADNKTAAGRQKNRRVEMSVIYK